MTEIKICPVCQGSEFQSELRCIDYTVSRETFQIAKCSRCSFLITTPRPDDQNIGSYYLSEDYISHTDKPASLIDRIYLLARGFTLQWKLSLIGTQNAQGKILDYGCGTGNFLEKCRENNWSIFGVEPSSEAREIHGEGIKTKIFKSIDDVQENNFDVITLWHVLEHVPDLNATVKKLKSKLSDGGTIFIAVPNPLSWDAKRYKEHWAAYDVPRHLWHFTQDTMKDLLQNNGLSIIKTIPMKLDAFYICLLSEKYKTGKKGILNMIKAALSGWRSNMSARTTTQYSSIIYIVK